MSVWCAVCDSEDVSGGEDFFCAKHEHFVKESVAEIARLRDALDYIASGWPDARRAAEDALAGRDPRHASPDGSKADG